MQAEPLTEYAEHRSDTGGAVSCILRLSGTKCMGLLYECTDVRGSIISHRVIGFEPQPHPEPIVAQNVCVRLLPPMPTDDVKVVLASADDPMTPCENDALDYVLGDLREDERKDVAFTCWLSSVENGGGGGGGHLCTARVTYYCSRVGANVNYLTNFRITRTSTSTSTTPTPANVDVQDQFLRIGRKALLEKASAEEPTSDDTTAQIRGMLQNMRGCGDSVMWQQFGAMRHALAHKLFSELPEEFDLHDYDTEKSELQSTQASAAVPLSGPAEVPRFSPITFATKPMLRRSVAMG
jgi:hypothetical protein